jgi:Xaa-Pro dipeptidase
VLTIAPPEGAGDGRHLTAIDSLYAAHLDEWQRRFEAAMASTGHDAVVIYAGEEQRVFRDDATYPYVAEPYFRAWAPLGHHPGSAIAFVPGERPRVVCFMDDSFWHEAPALPQGEWIGHFDLRGVTRAGERAASLGRLPGRIATIGPPGEGWIEAASVNAPALLAELDFTRARKTPYEVACIEQANAVAARGHRAAQQAFADQQSEFAIDLAYCAATAHHANELPYPSIVALNAHAAVLHYQHRRHEPPGSPSAFLLDAGAQCRGYAADVTRTVAREAPQMQALIDAVDALQTAVCADVRGGVDFVALNAATHERLAVVLQEQGIVRCSADEALARGLTRTFLPHGLGHLLGLQVHDAGGRMIDPTGEQRRPPAEHPMLRLTRVLEPGFVITIEPGLYFIPSLLDSLRAGGDADLVDWATVDSLRRFGGIRIEDNVLVTDTGSRNLTRPALSEVGAW